MAVLAKGMRVAGRLWLEEKADGSMQVCFQRYDRKPDEPYPGEPPELDPLVRTVFYEGYSVELIPIRKISFSHNNFVNLHPDGQDDRY